jgi:hypothetical protein
MIQENYEVLKFHGSMTIMLTSEGGNVSAIVTNTEAIRDSSKVIGL